METSIDRRIAVIGLGAMGGAMAATLHQAGWQVTGFDPAAPARAAAEAKGIRTTDDLASVAGAPYVLLSLPSAELVEATVPALLNRKGTIAIVDTTTSKPDVSAAMSALAAQHGVAFIDAPVSGGRAGAASGDLRAFIGATDSALQACSPVLMVLTGGQYDHVGGPGSGNVLKLLNNALAATNLIAVGEALEIARNYAIDPAVAASSISGASGSSAASSGMYPQWVLSGRYDSGFSLGLMARDAALALTVAQEKGHQPQLLGSVSARWQEALSVLGSGADFTEIARTVAPTLTSSTPPDSPDQGSPVPVEGTTQHD